MGTKARLELMHAVFNHFNSPDECDINWLSTAIGAKPRDAKRLHTAAMKYLGDPSDVGRGRLLRELTRASEQE